jgi:hypothetical protein
MQAEQREAEQEYQRTIHQQTIVFHLPTPKNWKRMSIVSFHPRNHVRVSKTYCKETIGLDRGITYLGMLTV